MGTAKDMEKAWADWHWGIPKDQMPLLSPAYQKGWTDAMTSAQATTMAPEDRPDREALQKRGEHPAPCARFCESKSYEIELRNLNHQLTEMKKKLDAKNLILPEGWAIVPITPSNSMKTAGIATEVFQDSPPQMDALTWTEVEAIYKSMILASPSPI